MQQNHHHRHHPWYQNILAQRETFRRLDRKWHLLIGSQIMLGLMLLRMRIHRQEDLIESNPNYTDADPTAAVAAAEQQQQQRRLLSSVKVVPQQDPQKHYEQLLQAKVSNKAAPTDAKPPQQQQ
jgi:hypothetical protein